MTPRAAILTSGIGLGVYVPALLIRDQMAELRPELEVLEGYYTAEHQRRLLAQKQACRDNFALAQMANRMARSVEDCLDGEAIDQLLDGWAKAGLRDLMVWSGFWLPVVERYRQRVGRLHVDCCRIDAEVSASFRVHGELAEGATEIWLWNWQRKQTLFEIPAGDSPLSFHGRDHRLVVHGGGWGLGTYRSRLAELERTPFSCDVVVHERAEAGSRAGDRYFMVDPEWRAWHRRHRFPPMAEVGRRCENDRHALYELIRRGKAIVSKPGGGTLIDSLSAATPVVLLDPYGHAEAKNGALWEHLGFGISYERWRDSGFDEALLEQLHENLLRRERNGPDYPREYVARVLARG